MKIVKWLIPFFALILNAMFTFAQSDSTEMDTSYYKIVTNDGGEFIGRIEWTDEKETKLITIDKGVVFIPKYAIKSCIKLDDDRILDQEYYAENILISTYFFSPTAFNLKKGECYVQSIWGLLYQIQYSITDNFSLGISTTFTVFPLTLTPRYSFEIKPKTRAVIGAHMGSLVFALSNENTINYGLGYTAITQGTTDNNFSMGLGYGFIKGGRKNYNEPALYFGGITRMGKKVSVMGELWTFYRDDVLVLIGGPGLRILKNSQTNIDFGFWIISREGDIFEFPLVYLSYTMGLDEFMKKRKENSILKWW